MPFVKSGTQKLVTEFATPRPDRIEGGRVSSFYIQERMALREQRNVGRRTKVSGIKSYYEWYENDGVVFASVNGLSEAAVGQGYHTAIEEDDPEEAKELVDEFGKSRAISKRGERKAPTPVDFRKIGPDSIDGFFFDLIFLSVFLRFLFHLLDFFFGELGSIFNGDLLFFARRLIFSRDI